MTPRERAEFIKTEMFKLGSEIWDDADVPCLQIRLGRLMTALEGGIIADRRELLAEDEAMIEAMAQAIYGMRDGYTTDFWRNYVVQARSSLAALRRHVGVE